MFQIDNGSINVAPFLIKKFVGAPSFNSSDDDLLKLV